MPYNISMKASSFLSVARMYRLANKQDLSEAVDVSVVHSSLHIDQLNDKYSSSLHVVCISLVYLLSLLCSVVCECASALIQECKDSSYDIC